MTSKVKIGTFNPFQKDPITGKLIHDLRGKVIIILGPRGAGKSTLIKHILSIIGDIPIIKVINGTEESTHHYSGFVPDIMIENDYEPEILEDFMKRQKNIFKKAKNDPLFRNVDKRAILLLDDCLYDNSWSKHKLMRFIFMNGRHLAITTIIAMQTPMGIPPALRSNIDYVFICRHNNENDLKTIYTNYVNGFKSKKAFEKVHSKCTSNFRVLVIHKTSKSDKMSEIVFHYKAQLHPHLRLGHPLLWEYHKNNFDSNYEDKQEKMEKEIERIKKEQKRRKRNNDIEKVELL